MALSAITAPNAMALNANTITPNDKGAPLARTPWHPK